MSAPPSPPAWSTLGLYATDPDVSRLAAGPLVAARPIDEAISSAGGVLFEALDDGLMCEGLPGVFCAGEMLDWEAPTGGYLLTACLSSGYRAGQGVMAWLRTAREAANP